MTKSVTTRGGLTYNLATGKDGLIFILRCPECGENLQLTDNMLDGKEPFAHESQKFKASYCSFSGPQRIGPELIATMQARYLLEEPAVTDESDWTSP